MIDREKIIQTYVEGYNTFNIDKMVADFDDSVVFENVQNGETSLSLTGLSAFKKQAEQAKAYFTKRTQTILSFTHFNEVTEIEISYSAILAMDMPNGLKSGQILNLKGKSIFHFLSGKIVKLIDVI